MGGGGGELAVGGAVRGGTGGAVGGGWGAMLRRRVRDTVRGLLRIISQFSAPGNNNRSGAGSLRESSLPTGLLGLTLATHFAGKSTLRGKRGKERSSAS